MKSFVSDLLIKFNLRFKSPATEQDYHRHIKPFADVNFQFFLVFLLLLQLGMLAFEILTKELVFAILIGLCLFSNTLLLIFRKKYHFVFEKAAIIFVTTIYVISALHFRKREYDGPSEFTRDQAFFETYGICLFHQIALKYLTGFLKVLIIDICAIIFRCILFYQSAWAFPFSFSIQILVDLAILYACYKKEVNSRTIYNQLLNQKEGTSKFKSLMVNSLPENIIIMDNTLTRELFANNAFQKIFRSLSGTSETRKDSRNDLLHRTYILKESLETVEALPSLVNKYLKENPTVTLWDFLQQGNRSRLFKEEVFIVYGTLTPPTAHKSGLKRRIFEIKIFSFRWDEEEAIVIILNEVTHRETILGLRLSDMSKDKVISSVSHELRTPLNGIQGMIQIMQKQADDPQLLTSLAICKSSADLLLHIINSIIDLQFLTKNKLVLHKSKVSVRELISQIGNLFIFQCEHKRLDLTLSIDEGAPEYIITDKERLMQVLVHLASNAVKFTFKGGITIGARVDPRTPESILFCVSDTGTGIKDNNKAALFKMFGHLENMNSVGTQGIGLGLTISKELVMRLKATKADNVIEMNSEFGKGSTFSFSLPFDLTQAEMEGADKEDFGEVGQEYDASDHRGLIIKSRRSSNRRFDDREEGSDSKFLSQLLMRKLGSDQEDDFEDIGEELGLDQRNISDFLYFGPIQEKLTHYVTRPPRYNTYKLIEGSSSSGKITFEESPTLKSLIKISSPGLQYEFHPKSQTDVPKEERREVRESPPMEEKGENFSDISSVPFKVNDSNRRKGVETFTNNLDNSQFLAREIQSATSIVSTPRERKKSRMTSRHFGRMQTKQYTSKSILVVDDNSFNLLVAQHIIEDSGFQVITAVSGQNGINEVKKRSKEGIEPFKLILMDLQMPVMDGFETTSILIKMMKANEIPEIPIVALTANTTEEDIAKCLQHGMVNHLGKPLNKEALVRVFNSLEES